MKPTLRYRFHRKVTRRVLGRRWWDRYWVAWFEAHPPEPENTLATHAWGDSWASGTPQTTEDYLAVLAERGDLVATRAVLLRQEKARLDAQAPLEARGFPSARWIVDGETDEELVVVRNAWGQSWTIGGTQE